MAKMAMTRAARRRSIVKTRAGWFAATTATDAVRFLRPPAFEDRLVGPARGGGAVVRAAHGPGQKRQAKDPTCNEGRDGRQVLHAIGNELRPRPVGMQQPGEPRFG